jgi:hypothetical protein
MTGRATTFLMIWFWNGGGPLTFNDRTVLVDPLTYRIVQVIDCQARHGVSEGRGTFAWEAPMPALFAYLLVVGLLLGGGYGALSWLAAPEPVKVAEAKPRVHARTGSEAKPSEAKPSEAKPSEAKAPEASSLAINGNDKAATASNNQPPSSVSEAGSVSSEQGAPAKATGPAAPDPQTRSANADGLSREAQQHNGTSSAEAGQGATRQSSQAAPLGSSAHAQSAASAAPAAARKVTRPRIRQAGRQPGRGALALMTMQTIEYPDGRRVTRLIPYRGDVRPLAFQLDQ